MKRTALVCALTLGLVACGGNPFDEDDATTGDTEPGTVFGQELDSDLTLNALVYNDNDTPDDPSDDTLLLNNIPFDNSDLTGGEYTRVGDLGTAGFGRFENPESGIEGESQFFAVFRRTEFAQVAAVGTGNQTDFGPGGVLAQQIGPASAPAARSSTYVFTGAYAGVRVSTAGNGSDDVTLVTGDARLTADILDFDDTGAVQGTVRNRELFDNQGNVLLGDDGNPVELTDFISLGQTDIDFANATINSEGAFIFQPVLDDNGDVIGNTAIAQGNWQGVFAGPNGEQIAGIVVLAEEAQFGETTVLTRETGSFIVDVVPDVNP